MLSPASNPPNTSGREPVSVDASVLPTGAATSAKQDTANTSLAQLDVALSTRTKPSDQQHAIVDSSALPTGAATSAKQDTGNTSLANLDVALSTRTKPADQQHAIVDSSALPTGATTEATALLIKTKTDNLDVALSTRTKPADQQHAIVDSSALPTGAATAALQTTGNTSLANLDVALSTRTKPSDQQHAIVDSSALPAGASTEATLALIKAKTDNLDAAISTRTKPADQQHAIVDSSALPTGASTSALQTTGNTSLANLDVALSTRTKPADQQHAIVDSSALPTGAATDTTVAAVTTSLGTDGATPPSIPGTGVRGWLRACYDKLVLLVAVFPVTFDTNSGNKSASTLRVVLATDQPALANKLLVTNTTDQSSHGTSDLVADDMVKWNGVAVSSPVATAPDGTQTAPVVRPIQRKQTISETTAQLTANSVFTGAWHDSQTDGTIFVTASSFADRASAAAGFVIQVSDDSSNASFTRTVTTSTSVISTLALIRAAICARYWRVVYTNGAAGSTTNLEINSTAYTFQPMLNPNDYSYGTAFSTPMVAIANLIAPPQSSDGDGNLAGQWPMNGTATRMGISPYLFNGATWDRARGNWNTTTGDTGAKAATFNGATQTNYDSIGAIITILLGTVSGSSPTLAAQLQYSYDAGTNWLNIGPAMANLTATAQTGVFHIHPSNLSQSAGATPANLTNGATQSVFLNMSLPRTWRIVYTIGGSSPSFAITAVYVNYIRG